MTKWLHCPECTKKLVDKPGDDGKPRPSCPGGHFVFYNNPIPATHCFVEYDGKYLILKRNNAPKKGEWDLPGGFIEPGEGPEEAIAREVKEETELEIRNLRMIGCYKSVYGETSHVVSFGFAAKAPSDQVKLSTESSEFAWHALENIPRLAFLDENQALQELRDAD